MWDKASRIVSCNRLQELEQALGYEGYLRAKWLSEVVLEFWNSQSTRNRYLRCYFFLLSLSLNFHTQLQILLCSIFDNFSVLEKLGVPK